MGVDIERLKVDAAYWDEVDPSNGEATHYDLGEDYDDYDEPGFMRFSDGWYFWNDEPNCWETYGITETYTVPRLLARLIERPATQSPEWDGDAPAIGWHGECTWGNKNYWFECVVLPYERIAFSKFGAWEVADIATFRDIEFRPIPTPEQRLREELESVIRYWLKGGENEEVISRALLAKYNLTEK